MIPLKIFNLNHMKIKFTLIVISLLAAINIYGQTSGTSVTDVILAGYSQKAYTSEPVTDQQLDLILRCGIKAPSAKNNQPWKFTVIKDTVAMKEVVKDILPGNLLIIVSGVESEAGNTPDFDCGLATESMFIAAHGLGLGARIYGGPAGTINSNKELFNIPSGYKAVVALRIGNVDKSVDAVSAASPRKTFEELVNFKN
jgi:nitroreductase